MKSLKHILLSIMMIIVVGVGMSRANVINEILDHDVIDSAELQEQFVDDISPGTISVLKYAVEEFTTSLNKDILNQEIYWSYKHISYPIPVDDKCNYEKPAYRRLRRTQHRA